MSQKVLIIGAGMAGIMAAKTLQEAGIEATILEARDRIGGRTRTDHSLGTSIDLGAAWIHGPVGNPLTPLQKAAGVQGANNLLRTQASEVVQLFNYDGSLIDMAEFSQGQLMAQAEIVRQLGSQLTPPVPDAVQSQEQLAEYCRGTIGELTAVQQLAYQYTTITRPSKWDATDADQIDWRLGELFLDLPGGDVLLYGGGYNQITDYLAQGLNVETAVIVQEIIYNDDGVQIITNKDTYHADNVIITVPLGVLKANQIKFNPPLPDAKQQAIERIGFGVAEKLVVLFDKFYWPKEKELFVYFAEDGSTHFSSWSNLGRYANLPILASYKSGSDTADFNQWSDDELIDRAMTVLQTMFGTMPPPLNFVRTNWRTDPFSQGSYSFNKVGQQPTDRDELAKPIGNRLFFAGEATHSYYIGTVHAAYETGVRAAREVIGGLGD